MTSSRHPRRVQNAPWDNPSQWPRSCLEPASIGPLKKCHSEARATFVCKFCRNFTSVGGSQKDQRTQVISEGTLGRSIRDGIETPRPSAGRRH
ncbi:hypothetical protein VDGL01_04140 [Verticillium dahliae]